MRYRAIAQVDVVRTPRAKQQLQLDRLKNSNAVIAGGVSAPWIRLAGFSEQGGNVFAELINNVEQLFARPDHRAIARAGGPIPPEHLNHNRTNTMRAICRSGIWRAGSLKPQEMPAPLPGEPTICH